MVCHIVWLQWHGTYYVTIVVNRPFHGPPCGIVGRHLEAIRRTDNLTLSQLAGSMDYISWRSVSCCCVLKGDLQGKSLSNGHLKAFWDTYFVCHASSLPRHFWGELSHLVVKNFSAERWQLTDKCLGVWSLNWATVFGVSNTLVGCSDPLPSLVTFPPPPSSFIASR